MNEELKKDIKSLKTHLDAIRDNSGRKTIAPPAIKAKMAKSISEALELIDKIEEAANQGGIFWNDVNGELPGSPVSQHLLVVYDYGVTMAIFYAGTFNRVNTVRREPIPGVTHWAYMPSKPIKPTKPITE